MRASWSHRSRPARKSIDRPKRPTLTRKCPLESLEDRCVLAAYVWVGDAGDLWSAADSWQVGDSPAASPPGAADDVTFDDSSENDVSAPAGTIVRSLTIESGYTGTISLDGDFKANYGLSQAGGTLNAGSGTLTVGRDLTVTDGTFNAGTSTVVIFPGPVGASSTVNAQGVALHNFTVDQGPHHFTVAGDLDVNGTLTLKGFNTLNGTILAGGHIVSSAGSGNKGNQGPDDGKIIIDGTGNQELRTVLPTDTNGFLPSVEIDKSGGTLFLSGGLVVDGWWTHKSGKVNAGSSTVKFVGGTNVVDTGSHSLNNVVLDTGGHHFYVRKLDVNGDFTIQSATNIRLPAGAQPGNLTVAGDVTSNDLTVSGDASIVMDGTGHVALSGPGDFPDGGIVIHKNGNYRVDANVTQPLDGPLTLESLSALNGVLSVGKNVTTNDTSVGGDGQIIFAGTGNQKLTAATSGAQIPGVIIDKTGGTLTLDSSNAIGVTGDWFYEQGTVNAAGSTIQLTGTGHTTVQTSSLDGSMVLNNLIVDFDGNYRLNADTYATVGGELTLRNLSALQGTIVALGDVTTEDTSVGGSGKIVFEGTNNQTLTAAISGAQVPGVTIDKTGGTLTLDSSNVIGVTGDWLYEQGAVNAAGSTIQLAGTGHTTVQTSSLEGSMVLNNLIVDFDGNYRLNADTYATVDGELTLRNLSALQGTIVARGDVTTEDTSVGGDGLLIFSGNQNQTLKSTIDSTVEHGQIPGGMIDKTGGTLTLDPSKTIGVTGGWDYVKGDLNASGSTISFEGTGHRTVNTGPTSQSALNNVEINTAGNYNVNATRLDVNGRLTIHNVGSINGAGAVTVAGDLTSYDNTVGGTANIMMDGNVDAAITGGDFPNGGIVLQKGSAQGVTANVTHPLDGPLRINSVSTTLGLSGTFHVGRDVITSDTTVGGNGVLVFSGTGNQKLIATVAGAQVPGVEINKPSGNFTIDSANLIAVTGPRGWKEVNGNVVTTGSTVEFRGVSKSVDATTPFDDVVLRLGSADTLTATNMIVNDDLTIASGHTINNTIEVRGDVTTSATGVDGSGKILFNGTGDQRLIATIASAQVPAVEIDKPVSGTFTVDSGNAVAVTGPQGWNEVAGNVVTTGSTVEFRSVSKSVNAATPFHDVVLNLGSADTLTATSMKVDGDLTIASGHTINGMIEARGDVTTGSTLVDGSGTILINGTGEQTLAASVSGGQVPNVAIDKESGTLTIDGANAIGVYGSWTNVNGDVDATGSTIRFVGGSKTVDDGGHAFNDVVLSMGSANVLTVTSMTVGGDLTISSLSGINGPIDVHGDVTSTDNSVGGSGVLRMVGGEDVSISGGDFPNGGIVIAKNADTTVNVMSDLTLSALTVTSGTLDVDVHVITVSGNTSVAGAGTLAFFLTPTTTQLKVTSGALTLEAGSTIEIEAADNVFTEYDLITSSGSLTDNGVVFDLDETLIEALVDGLSVKVRPAA